MHKYARERAHARTHLGGSCMAARWKQHTTARAASAASRSPMPLREISRVRVMPGGASMTARETWRRPWPSWLRPTLLASCVRARVCAQLCTACAISVYVCHACHACGMRAGELGCPTCVRMLERQPCAQQPQHIRSLQQKVLPCWLSVLVSMHSMQCMPTGEAIKHPCTLHLQAHAAQQQQTAVSLCWQWA